MPIREQQKTNRQHAVPQNIMDVEFKLIGDLTMRQFVYIVIFAIMAYMARLIVPQPFTWIFVVVLALLGLALAFVPIEERGLDIWAINFFKAIYSPTERIWRKKIVIPEAFAYEQNLEFLQKEMVTLAPTASRRKLEEYLETSGIASKEDSLDIPEKEYIDMVRIAFKDLPKESPPDKKKPADKKVQEEGPEGEKEIDISEEQGKMDQIIRSRMSKADIKLPDEDQFKRKTKLQPIGEHAGRKFLNLTPGQGQIVLPIRGEKVLKVESDVEESYLKRDARVQEMLDRREQDQSSDQKKALRMRKLPPEVNRPNIIGGKIISREGKLLEDVVLTIRNEKGEAVRAIKTNKLGKFLISSPLPNGEYSIEVDKDNETGFSFDIIPFSVRGELLPSLEIIGT